jgi:threonine/homoserine efflux transporter RhtA
MAPSDIRRRLKRRVIILLVVVNAALWASYVWLGENTGRPRGGPHTAATKVRSSQAPIGK